MTTPFSHIQAPHAAHTAYGWLARAGTALVVVLLAGCAAASTGAAATPSVPPTSTVASTPSTTANPSLPTVRYTIGTRGQTLQDVPAIALPVSSGTNYHWTQATCTGLACTPGGTADPGGPAGHTIYQVFACQLTAGQTSGQCTFIFTVVGSAAPVQMAVVQVNRLSDTQTGDPALTFAITTNAHLNSAASIALEVNAGTHFQWTAANDIQGMTCASQGLADPGGPPGHAQYQVFAFQLTAGQTAGQGHMAFAEVGASIPTETAQVHLQLGQ